MRYLHILLLCVVLTSANSCKKAEEGFISDKLFYRANPFIASQGVVSYSAPLEVDGSTAPLSVKLLDVRNKATGVSVMADLLKEREVTTFTGQVTLADSTLDSLAKKIKVGLKKPLNINPIGGRIEMSHASSYIAGGSYVIDIEVSNVRGTRVLKNACDIVLQPATNPYTIVYRRIQTAVPGNDADRVFIADDPVGFPIDVKRTESTTNKIIMKWVDKNNKPFNPKTDLGRWDLVTPIFKDWSPFYPEVITDSTLEYQFPKTGLTFPIHAATKLGGDNGICYYRLLSAANDLNKNMRLTTAIRYHADGIYEVTFHINIAAKK